MGVKILGLVLAGSLVGLSMCASPDTSIVPVSDMPVPNPRSAVRHLDHPVASDHPAYEAIDRKINDLRQQVDELHRRIEKHQESR